LRLSVGIQDVNNLYADLDQALAVVAACDAPSVPRRIATDDTLPPSARAKRPGLRPRAV
jgi:hypothetical protein